MAVNGTAATDAVTPATALMTTSRQSQNTRNEALERVLISGDLSGLSAADRIEYYRTVCGSLNLNPLTKPFEYIQLNGKLVLYAKRDCTDQLRLRDRISIRIVSREVIDDMYVVTAQASTPDGRQDESTGAVTISGLKGDAKANAYMKCETKAKRRATLSICGLGLLDETEVVTVPQNEISFPQNDISFGTRAAQVAVAERKIKDLQAQAIDKSIPQNEISFPPATSAWTNRGEMRAIFARLREAVGEVEYAKEMQRAGVSDPTEFRYSNPAKECYARLVAIAAQEVA